MTSSSLSSARSSFFNRRGSIGTSLSVFMDTPPPGVRFLELAGLTALEKAQTGRWAGPAGAGPRFGFPGLRIQPEAAADAGEGPICLDSRLGTLGGADEGIAGHLELPPALPEVAQHEQRPAVSRVEVDCLREGPGRLIGVPLAQLGRGEEV